MTTSRPINAEPDWEPEPLTEDLAARAFSHGEFDGLYMRLAPSLYAWAAVKIPPSIRSFLEADEILQETWVRAIDRIEAYDPTTRGFRRWIFKIASLVLHEGFRRVARREGIGDAGSSKMGLADRVPSHLTTVSRRVARDEGLRSFVQEVAHLATDDKRLLLWRGLEGLPYDEVAQRLGVKENTAMKRWQRLRGDLEKVCAADLLES